MNDRGDNDRGVGRRGFLRSGAAGAGLALTLAGCGAPERKLIPALIPDDRIIPGTDRWTVTTCALCPGACGIRVRTMAGEARVQRDGREFRQEALQVKKIEGNASDPVNRGGVCARGQAAPNIIYHPDRYRRPMKLAGPRGSGRHEEISWEEADAILDRELAPLKATGRHPGLALISGPSFSQRCRAVEALLRQAGSDLVFELDHPGYPSLREANRRTFGLASLETHDIANARYVIGFGAPLLEAHASPVAHARALADMRQARPGERGRFVQIESRFSLTAANADEWIPVRPGFEADLALSIAGEILRGGLVDAAGVSARVRGFEEFRAMVLERFAPEHVSAGSGVPAETIRRLAREFASGQPGSAIAGGAAIAHESGVMTAGAVQALNVLVGAVGVQGGVSLAIFPTGVEREPPERDWQARFRSALPSIRTLVLFDSDPLGSMPRASSFGKALERIPFVISFATCPNESSANADLVLPDASFLERWDIALPEAADAAVVALSQPVVRRMYESRDAVDVLADAVGRAAGRPPETGSAGFMETRARSEFAKLVGSKDGADDAWDELKRTGFRAVESAAGGSSAADLSWLCGMTPSREAAAGEFPFHLVPFPTAQFGFGESAALPWMQELPDPMTSVVWGGWLELHPGTAKALGVEDGDVVRVESRTGAVESPVLVTPAARPDTVALPFGPGRRSAGRFASSRGANPWDVVEPLTVQGAGESAWAATRVRVVKTSKRARPAKLGDDRGAAPAGLRGRVERRDA
jgi:menaquinone reductase, molybdopterin-binding-like subunit